MKQTTHSLCWIFSTLLKSVISRFHRAVVYEMFTYNFIPHHLTEHRRNKYLRDTRPWKARKSQASRQPARCARISPFRLLSFSAFLKNAFIYQCHPAFFSAGFAFPLLLRWLVQIKMCFLNLMLLITNEYECTNNALVSIKRSLEKFISTPDSYLVNSYLFVISTLVISTFVFIRN